MARNQFIPPPDLPGEEWRPIVGFESLYAVSNCGRVRLLVDRANYTKGYILRGVWDFRNGVKRYRRVYLTKRGKQRSFSVHCLVMAAFKGPPPKGEQVNHIDGDKGNNRYENLEYCTASENVRHAFRTGIYRNVMSPELAKEIREATGKQRDIATKFGVNYKLVSKIKLGQRWGWT